MAKAGMRRPSPKSHMVRRVTIRRIFPKMMSLLYRRFRVRRSLEKRKQIRCNDNWILTASIHLCGQVLFYINRGSYNTPPGRPVSRRGVSREKRAFKLRI